MHKCVRCGTTFQDTDSSILRGCSSCGSIFFLYLKTPQDAVEISKIESELKQKDTTLEKELAKKIKEKKEEVEEEKVEEERIPEEKAERKKERKIEFGIETVRMPKEGVYEINLDALMKKRPLIILEKEKVYFIHLPSAFEAGEETEDNLFET